MRQLRPRAGATLVFAVLASVIAGCSNGNAAAPFPFGGVPVPQTQAPEDLGQAAAPRNPAPQTEAEPRAAADYVPWTDPNEHAFSLEVPSGWAISGGMYHPSPVQPRGVVQAVSPDGWTEILIGDKDTPTFVYGNVIASSGFEEGDLYSPNGGGAVFVVMDYIGAQRAASAYVENRWGSTCPGIEMTGLSSLTTVSAQLTEIEGSLDVGGVQTNVEVAQATFTCDLQGTTMQGFFVAKVKSQTADMGGVSGVTWWLDGAFGFLAPTGNEASAVARLGHMAETIRIDPEWLAAQLQTTAQVAEMVTEHSAEMNHIISESWRETTCGWGWIDRCTPIPR